MKMLNKKILFGILILSIVILAGCRTNINIDANEAKNEVECRNIEGDYIWVAGRCCPDTNNNNFCDDDEGLGSCTTGKECEQSGCMDYNQFIPYDCVVGEDNCLHKKEVNIQIDRCSVECLNAEGCNLGQKCVNYKCENKVCGDGQCDDTENCKCVDCPTPKDSKCCEGVVYKGDCCSNEDCNEDEETCENNICTLIPKCGDGMCNGDETCLTCDKDCIKEGEFCCNEVVVSGDCCTNEDCEGDEICTDNVCTTIEQPINETGSQTANETGNATG